MDLLDRLWAGEFNLDDQANWVENYILAYVITIPGAWLAINSCNGIFVVWLTRYMGKLEKNFRRIYGKFTIDKVCRSRKKLNEFVKKRSKSKCGYQWSDANNGKKKLCWKNLIIRFLVLEIRVHLS